MIVLFDSLGAVFAFKSAVFWFLSAARAWPKNTEPRVPGRLVEMLASSIRMNRWAAIFAGLSALCLAGHLIVDYAEELAR